MAKRNGKGLIASALIALAALLPGLLVPDRAEAADRPALAGARTRLLPQHVHRVALGAPLIGCPPQRCPKP